MTILIDEKLLKPKVVVTANAWRLWEKKNPNLHRGVIDWSIEESYDSIDDVEQQIRDGVKAEFKPGWFRGFGFGTILHFQSIPEDFGNICNHIDTRNKTGGVWQWAIVCFDDDRLAVGIHTWLHGHLRPVYDSALDQLRAQEYTCESVDAEMDKLFATLGRVARVCRMLERVGGVVS